MKRLKMLIVVTLLFVLVIRPIQTACASTYVKTSTPSHTFQNTDGEFDVVYCTGTLTQDYGGAYGYISYSTRTQYFGIKEVGCGGVDIWSVSGACFKNSSGSTVKTFTDWNRMTVLVSSGTSVLSAQKSKEVVTYHASNGYVFTFNYLIGGSEFYIIPFPTQTGTISMNIG